MIEFGCLLIEIRSCKKREPLSEPQLTGLLRKEIKWIKLRFCNQLEERLRRRIVLNFRSGPGQAGVTKSVILVDSGKAVLSVMFTDVRLQGKHAGLEFTETKCICRKFIFFFKYLL